LKKKTLAGILQFFGRFLVSFSPEKSDLDLSKKLNEFQENSPFFLKNKLTNAKLL
jgi:hypothetical protein